MPRKSPVWSVYVIECADGSLYTGIATDVTKRFAQHQHGGGRAAKYLRGRRPLRLVFNRAVGSMSVALQLEAKVKRLARWEKEVLLHDGETFRVLLEECSRRLS